MNCPSCRSRVSRGARVCAACGDAIVEEILRSAPADAIPTVVVPRSRGAESLAAASSGGNGHRPHTGDFGTPAAVAFDDDPTVLELLPGACEQCGEGLEPEARFCSFCGSTVGAEEPVVAEATPAPAEPVPAVLAPEEPAERTQIAGSPPPRASGTTVLRFEPRRPSESSIEGIPGGSAPTEPEPGKASWLDAGFDVRTITLGLAALALVAAVAIHVIGPAGAPGMTAGELELSVHLRAAEWLLGGILVALLGLLARR
jgi:hypothetical protein